MCFPGRDCVQLPVHCGIALLCCCLPVQDVRVWYGWTLFSGRLERSLSSKLERGSVDAGALVRAVMHSRARSHETV